MIPVIPDLAIRKEFPCSDQIAELIDGRLRVITLASVQISVENTSTSKEDYAGQHAADDSDASCNTNGYPSTRKRINA